MNSAEPGLPCPHLPIRIDLPADDQSPLNLSALPARPGVFLFQADADACLALMTTANLRRLVSSKLQPVELQDKPSRRINYRALVRTIRAVAVGSAFEADWAYLQLARRHLPLTYRGLLDRWQAWFIHCDPDSAFPQWVKTTHPGRPPTGKAGVYLGPMPDKHAAARYTDLLQNAFDLCRYHHILVQAPRATACAYKEMGRCPAPCDGSVSMDSYRGQIRRAIGFACTPFDTWRRELEQAMQQASAHLDFEAARQHQRKLERTAPASKREFRHVDRLERFALVGLMPAERLSWARLFAIRGGWVEPVIDLPMDAEEGLVREALEAVGERAKPQAAGFSEAGIENIGMVCVHLFRSEIAGKFLRLDENLSAADVQRTLGKLSKKDSMPQTDPAISEQGLEDLGGQPTE